jgi:hypothetical protein
MATVDQETVARSIDRAMTRAFARLGLSNWQYVMVTFPREQDEVHAVNLVTDIGDQERIAAALRVALVQVDGR